MLVKNHQFSENQGDIAKHTEVRRGEISVKAVLHKLKGSTVNTFHCCVARNADKRGSAIRRNLPPCLLVQRGRPVQGCCSTLEFVPKVSR